MTDLRKYAQHLGNCGTFGPRVTKHLCHCQYRYIGPFGFVNHHDQCPNRKPEGGWPCTCGLVEALDADPPR
jgi:hypothetical protein